MSRPHLHWSALWGVIGVVALLSQAIARLAPVAYNTLQAGLTTGQWVAVALGSAFMAHAEGYKGFQKAFSPRVAARALVAHTRSPWAKVFAPFFCMALFDATKKRRVVSWILLTVIVGLVVSVRFLPAPWRGIVDAAVVVGLLWGVIATILHFVHAAMRGTSVDPELGPAR